LLANYNANVKLHEVLSGLKCVFVQEGLLFIRVLRQNQFRKDTDCVIIPVQNVPEELEERCVDFIYEKMSMSSNEGYCIFNELNNRLELVNR
jgi:hypothetical protein